MAKKEIDTSPLIKHSDEELFIELPDKSFWTAKCLSPRRAVRFHAWLARIAGSIGDALEGIDGLADVSNWPKIIGRVIGILDEDNYWEILSIASGHTREEMEANEDEYDYAATWDCLIEFVEVNKLGSLFSDFFSKITGVLPPAPPETPQDSD